ncbi:hypothetical protein [Mycolicibacterium mageritense]|uniref:hypothetical protein n=1 Tax=Mycolicibacterium mageritense TaxID=53462 RepID=UPI001E3039D9|nr:hypothetical protein [Mycolicibacterium mageritense]GJJ19910.1 hypothetical protein MTY414_35830 [Mycolicibacterium mageritense]
MTDEGLNGTDSKEPSDEPNDEASRPEGVKTAVPVKYSEQWWEPRNNVGRCNGHRKNGNRCQKPAINGAAVCRTHGGATRHVRAKARQRLEEASLMLAKELLKMATDDDVSDAVKLAAIKDSLDRAGLKAPTQAEVTLAAAGPQPWESVVAGLAPMTRAESRAARGVPDTPHALPPGVIRSGPPTEGEIVDAEIVPDPHVQRPDVAADAPAWAERGNVPPRRAQPGTGLMTLADANEELARAERAYNERNDPRR